MKLQLLKVRVQPVFIEVMDDGEFGPEVQSKVVEVPAAQRSEFFANFDNLIEEAATKAYREVDEAGATTGPDEQI